MKRNLSEEEVKQLSEEITNSRSRSATRMMKEKSNKASKPRLFTSTVGSRETEQSSE